jgi:hypothetical protein
VAIDLRERQLLAQLVALAAVAGEVDPLGVEERFVEPVELLLHDRASTQTSRTQSILGVARARSLSLEA